MHRDVALVPPERIERSILLIRYHKVMLDADLAALYGVETKQLVRAVKRNISRFPDDFMLQLSKDEFGNLRYHFGTSSQWGGRRYPPYAFTEQGVAMLSSVLRQESLYFDCHSGLDPESSICELDSRFRWNDGFGINVKKRLTHY